MSPDQNDKYINDYWNTISRAVGQILHNSPGVRVSFEQMYSIVYKCVCDGFAEKMHSDLLAQCSHHLEEVDRSLDACDPRIPQQYGEESLRLVIAFHEALELYLIAVQQITPIFAYMNKFYVEALLQTSLQVELMDLFRQKVADRRMDRIMANVEELLKRPFALPPATVSSMFANLHCVGRGEYGRRYPNLFSRYVPGVLPPMKESDIEAHINEMKDLQSRLRSESEEGAVGGGLSRKRRGDDENYGPTVCVAVGQQASPTQYN
ncbi:CDK2-associated and cullin domain-containing protein 1 isoform X2 [Anabrus simplex]|uniref:CDK2-associated and cullin domain-containing protein 1 isoform X2 n=1 Tax=Anabrus simplex TaxID=316456 RepID=UPI0034DDB057